MSVEKIELAEANLKISKAVAAKYKKRAKELGMEFGWLLEEAHFALFQAVSEFEGHDTDFPVFAEDVITKAIEEFLAAESGE